MSAQGTPVGLQWSWRVVEFVANSLADAGHDADQLYLRQEKLSIEDVAFLLGFGDTSAFHRAFKRWHGVTPAQFRRGD